MNDDELKTLIEPLQQFVNELAGILTKRIEEVVEIFQQWLDENPGIRDYYISIDEVSSKTK